ncbi:MAG TPA: site-2 protease family protein [Methanomassiliicoccales archaeon]|nr:site-2 protease family protein [Methanomassiliicoccales archaeon]
MADLTPWFIFAVIVTFWAAIIIVLRRKKLLANKGVSPYGPFIMWRTEGGKKFIDWLSRPERFWRAYAVVCKVLCMAVAIFIMALLIWEATIVPRIPADRAPTPQMMLGIPGINPVIPIVYGIIGLAVAIVVHEFAHGILTRVGKMKIKALGLILLVVPMGAFVEPDEQQIASADRKRRTSVYAAGPATNVFVALLCAFLFCGAFMASAQPVYPNPVVISEGKDSPAFYADLGYGMQIMEIGGVPIATVDDFNSLEFEPGTVVTTSYFYKGGMESSQVTAGLTLVDVSKGLAADQAGLEVGMILAMLNGTTIHNQQDLQAALNLTVPYTVVSVRALQYDAGVDAFVVTPIDSITLSSRKDYYMQVDPGLVNESFVDHGFLGVNTAYMGLMVNSPDAILQRLAHPYAGVNDPSEFVGASLLFIALPFQGLAPINSPLADLFVPTGLMAGVPPGIFWFVANCLYWIFWIDLMVGMTNVLPAVPLDGGFLFRDGLDALIQKFRKNSSEKERAKYVAAITYTLAIFVFMLIIWQLIGPRLL